MSPKKVDTPTTKRPLVPGQPPPDPAPPPPPPVSILHPPSNSRTLPRPGSESDSGSHHSIDSGGGALVPTVSVVILNEETSIPNIPITGKETEQDLVDKYNEYYRHHTQQTRKGVLASDSVSSTALTHEQLIRSRACRLVIMRRLLIFCSLLLWGFSLVIAGFWFMTRHVWPRHFTLTEYAQEAYQVDLDDDVRSYSGLAITVLHCGIVGAWGLIAASCGQDKCLKRFMLTAPWFLLISIYCGFLAVKFVGDLSQQKLGKVLLLHQGFYFDADINKNKSREGWDTAQLFLRCCGIESPDEWVKLNQDLIAKVPRSCCMNAKGRHETNQTLVERCIKDDNLHSVFPVGCKEKLFNFVTIVGAGVTAICFSITFVMVLAVIFAHKFYVLKKKLRLGHYNYPVKEFFIDFTYIRPCVTLCRKRRHRRRRNDLEGGGDDLSLDEYALYSAMEDAVKKEEAALEAQSQAEHEEYLKDKKNRKGSSSHRRKKKKGSFISSSHHIRGDNNVSLLYRRPSQTGGGGPRSATQIHGTPSSKSIAIPLNN